jgi:phosphoglycolate phosphatase-like HAD superfamily hydrolase
MTDITLNRRESIAFDFDGTLISISIRDYNVYSDILLSNSFVPLNFDLYWEYKLERIPLFDLLNKNNKIGNEFYCRYLNQRNEKIESPEYLLYDELFYGTTDLLKLVSLKYDCYLVTSRFNKEATLNQIENLGIKDYFKEIIITKKNKLEAYRQIPNLQLIVGDSENDILPANELNVNSFALTTGIRSFNFLKKLNPTFIGNDLNELSLTFINNI